MDGVERLRVDLQPDRDKQSGPIAKGAGRKDIKDIIDS